VQQRLREQLRRRSDVRVDEVVVSLPAYPGVPVAHVPRVVEQLFVIGAHVQRDRDHPRRVDPRRRGVDRQLAHRDVDPTDTPATDPQDLLGVGGNDKVHVVGTQPQIGQRRLHPLRGVNRQVDPARAAVLVAVPLDRLPDRRVIHDRQHLPQVLPEQPVEQHLVAVLQHGQEDVLSRSVGCS
jgi:hypothetical protein